MNQSKNTGKLSDIKIVGKDWLKEGEFALVTPPNPDNTELDEILEELTQYVHGVASASKHYGIFIGGEPVTKAKRQINALITKAREEALNEFAEYAHTRYKGCTQDEYAYDGEVITMVEDYQDRLKELEENL